VLNDKAVEDKLNDIIPENTIINKDKIDLNSINLTEPQTIPNMETKQTKGLKS